MNLSLVILRCLSLSNCWLFVESQFLQHPFRIINIRSRNQKNRNQLTMVWFIAVPQLKQTTHCLHFFAGPLFPNHDPVTIPTIWLPHATPIKIGTSSKLVSVQPYRASRAPGSMNTNVLTLRYFLSH